MKNRVITISREFGSGGRTIGKKVAEKLGIPCYDAEIIQEMARQTGFAPDYVKEAGEYAPGSTVVGAQAANELLNIIGIKASFVLTEYHEQIYVSARSIDEVNVQIIMEKMGGGGHLNTAGCQLEGVSIPEAIGILKGTLDKMIDNGDLVVD